MTIGLDTSVVVRLLVGQPREQAEAARRRVAKAFDEGEPIVVTDLVLAEAYHALHCHYAVPRDQAQRLLHSMATSGVMEVEPAEAVDALRARRGPGLMDRLIHARHRRLAAVTLTFDERQARLEGARRVG